MLSSQLRTRILPHAQIASRGVAQLAQEYLEPDIKSLPVSATLGINMRTQELRRQNKPVIAWGFGQSPFPVPDSVVQSLRDAAHHKDYLNIAGLPELRHAIADYYSRRIDQVDVDPELVCVAPGSKELMFYLSIALKAEFLLPGPSWVSYAPQAHINRKPYSVVPTYAKDRFLFSAEGLEEALRVRGQGSHLRILVLNYPSNPTGVSYTEDQLKDLAQVCRRHNVVVLSDEIYGELHHQGQHISIAKHYREGTIISSGLSKWCGAGGWRLGYFSFPREMAWLAAAFHSIGSETFSCVSSPIQQAAVTAYNGIDNGEIADYLTHSRRILASLADYLVRGLTDLDIDVCHPDGGFYLAPGFKSHRRFFQEKYGVTEPSMMCRVLLDEANIAMLPGSNFHMGNDRLRTRLAYTNFDGATALQASRAVPGTDLLDDAWVREHCPEVADGVTKLGQFFGRT